MRSLLVFLAILHLGWSNDLESKLQSRQYHGFDGPTPLTDDNIQSAVKLWYNSNENNRTLVEALYGGPIGNWDTSRLTSLEEVFLGLDYFEADLSSWDVSRVTNMRATFYFTSGFEGNVGNWDVSRVHDMRVLLAYSSDFMDDISQWNTASLQNLRAAFTEYDKTVDEEQGDTLPISTWKTPNLLDMEGVFAGTDNFQTDLTGWDTSKVTSMAMMLENTVNFYGGDLSVLDTSSVVNMEGMFHNATNVRAAHKISAWDTSKVQHMDRIFFNASVVNNDDTPDDVFIFYLCWDMTSLRDDTLSEAFCHSSAGGFKCDCVPDNIAQHINSGCNDSKQGKHCYGALGDSAPEVLVEAPPEEEALEDLVDPVDLLATSGAAARLCRRSSLVSLSFCVLASTLIIWR